MYKISQKNGLAGAEGKVACRFRIPPPPFPPIPVRIQAFLLRSEATIVSFPAYEKVIRIEPMDDTSL